MVHIVLFLGLRLGLLTFTRRNENRAFLAARARVHAQAAGSLAHHFGVSFSECLSPETYITFWQKIPVFTAFPSYLTPSNAKKVHFRPRRFAAVLLLIFPGLLSRPCADFAFIGAFCCILGWAGNVYKKLGACALPMFDFKMQ